MHPQGSADVNLGVSEVPRRSRGPKADPLLECLEDLPRRPTLRREGRALWSRSLEALAWESLLFTLRQEPVSMRRHLLSTVRAGHCAPHLPRIIPTILTATCCPQFTGEETKAQAGHSSSIPSLSHIPTGPRRHSEGSFQERLLKGKSQKWRQDVGKPQGKVRPAQLGLKEEGSRPLCYSRRPLGGSLGL